MGTPQIVIPTIPNLLEMGETSPLRSVDEWVLYSLRRKLEARPPMKVRSYQSCIKNGQSPVYIMDELISRMKGEI